MGIKYKISKIGDYSRKNFLKFVIRILENKVCHSGIQMLKVKEIIYFFFQHTLFIFPVLVISV